MAIAAAHQGNDRRAVAVIGDGAMSAGMAFEALNHAGSLPVDLLVVLNDNDMSISENVGALSNYLARVISGRCTRSCAKAARRVLRQLPTMRELARRSEEHVKGMVLPGTLFEEMGFNYVGPIDGHDLKALLRALRTLRGARGPQLLHVVTRKGKGYAPAEADPINWHGPGPFDPVSGTIYKEKAGTPSYSQVFGQWLCDMAERDPRIVGITPAMREGSALVEFSRRFPDRYFDVAIAEQHAVTFAAGLAAEGLKPGGGDLLDLPAARLRPADSRRGAAESAGGVRARPRRPRRQRWRDAPGQLRSVLSALHSEHGDHGAGR